MLFLAWKSSISWDHYCHLSRSYFDPKTSWCSI